MIKKKKTETKELTADAALEKVRRFCNYQERCASEVVKRLKEWNVSGDDAKKIVETLREDNLLNDERFAKAFVRGKFRIKSWGNIKIQQALRTKSIPNDIIQTALAELPQKDYDETLQRLLERKNQLLKESNPKIRKKKLATFAMQKGYSGDKVWKMIDVILDLRNKK